MYLYIKAMLLGAFCSNLFKLKDDLQKTSCHDLRIYALIHFSAFWSVEVHFHNENLILPYFSSLSMVAISVPFPEARNREGTESGLSQPSVEIRKNQIFADHGNFVTT